MKDIETLAVKLANLASYDTYVAGQGSNAIKKMIPVLEQAIKKEGDRRAKEERERIEKVLQDRVDYYTQGTGKVGYQLTGEYPTSSDEILEIRLQSYFDVLQAITPKS